MAPEWEMGMEFGMGMGMGMGVAANNAPTFPSATAPPAYLYGLQSSDNALRIDDLLDFSNHDLFPSSDKHIPPPPSSSAAGGGGGGRPFDGESGSSSDHCPKFTTFPDDLYIPSEEAAELEWLSNFVEESFSDIPYPSSATDFLAAGNADIRSDPSSSVPGRGARSKRSRASTATATTAAATWSSLTHLPPPQTSSSSTTSSSSSSEFPPSKTERRKGGSAGETSVGVEGGVRRCTHCASEKTPQWRTGPLGPKTLCNACGVRYKSGRLVPEYRPAASPTFVLTQHSNSHRKVMELRRHKELHLVTQHSNHPASSSSTSAAASARPDLLFHDYEVC